MSRLRVQSLSTFRTVQARVPPGLPRTFRMTYPPQHLWIPGGARARTYVQVSAGVSEPQWTPSARAVAGGEGRAAIECEPLAVPQRKTRQLDSVEPMPRSGVAFPAGHGREYDIRSIGTFVRTHRVCPRSPARLRAQEDSRRGEDRTRWNPCPDATAVEWSTPLPHAPMPFSLSWLVHGSCLTCTEPSPKTRLRPSLLVQGRPLGQPPRRKITYAILCGWGSQNASNAYTDYKCAIASSKG